MSRLCHCGSGASFEDCCNPYLKGERSAPTAEALMRSRYSAFATRNWAYLECTQIYRDNSPPTPDMVWLGLNILATQAGNALDNDGTVEFVASYSHQDRLGSLHEISRFRKEGGEWLYVDGLFPHSGQKSKPGRNAPCPCNSGQKFKKCCGKG